MLDGNDAFVLLCEDLGISTLPQDKKEELITKMTELLLKRIFVETMERLSEQERYQYEKLVAVSGPEEIAEYFKTRIKNYDQMVQKIIMEFRHEMLS